MDKPCFELKGSLFTLTVLQLFSDDLSLLETQLNERVKMAPDFFNHTPVVIDLHKLPADQQALDFFDLRELLLSLSFIPVGVKGAEKPLHIQLEAAGMAVLAEAKAPRKKPQIAKPEIQPGAESSETSTEQTTAAEAETKQQTSKSDDSSTTAEKNSPTQTDNLLTRRAAKIVRQTIRSGQQIYAPSGDLVIIGSVSTGAEILADGDIHVYGTLRGRALAGVRGDQQASIFCHCLQAELISIAGIYLLSDDIAADKIGASVQISLQDEKLQMESI